MPEARDINTIEHQPIRDLNLEVILEHGEIREEQQLLALQLLGKIGDELDVDDFRFVSSQREGLALEDSKALASALEVLKDELLEGYGHLPLVDDRERSDNRLIQYQPLKVLRTVRAILLQPLYHHELTRIDVK